MNQRTDIFTNSNTDFSIEVFRLEEMTNAMFDEYQRYDFHQVIWFVKSNGDNVYSIDFNKHIVQDNQIAVIYPQQIEQIDLVDKEGFLFAIHNDIFFEINQIIQSDYLNGYLSNIFISPNTHTTSILHKIIDLLIDEYQNDNRTVLIQTYLQSFLFHVATLCSDTLMNSDKKELLLFIEFLKLLDISYNNEKEVVFYANSLNITEKKLSNICKSFSGKTTKQMIQDRIILEIKKEIKIGIKSLKEIAFDLKFNEYAYFTRFFKQQTNLTPSQFRGDK